MIVYHGSNEVILKPKISFSRNFLDFGKGFYVTTFEEQAKQWALRKASRFGGTAIVNIYDFSLNFHDYKVCNFKNENENWLDFICNCRLGNDSFINYDIIQGRVANDDIFKTIDLYMNKIWTKEQTINELKYYKENDQICFANQKTIDNELHFKNSFQL